MRLLTFLLALPAWAGSPAIYERAAGSPGEARAQKLETDIVKVIEGVMHEQ